MLHATKIFKKCRVVAVWYYNQKINVDSMRGGVAHMVERALSMREVPGSIPGTSTSFWNSFFVDIYFSIITHLRSYHLPNMFLHIRLNSTQMNTI